MEPAPRLDSKAASKPETLISAMERYIVQKLPPPCTVRGFAPCIPGDGTLPDHVVVDPRGKIAHDTLTNLGPRVGFAYRVGGPNRGSRGAGIIYDNLGAVSQMAQNIEGACPTLGS